MKTTRTFRLTAFAALAVFAAACATARQYLALRQVSFAIDQVAAIRLAGVSLDNVRRPSDLNAIDYGRIAAAALRRQMPLEFDMRLMAENPADNNTSARLTRFAWTLFLNSRETVSGTMDTSYTFPAGVPTPVRLPVRLDLAQFFQGSAADAIDLALGLAGYGTRQTDVELRAVPTIDTPLGPIQYPQPIVVRKTVGATPAP